MEKQVIINTIACLSATIDSFNRAGRKDEIDLLIAKILELVKEI